MKVYDATSLRNVALVGHSGAGKTQLVSALLFAAGAVNRLGKVDDGTTTTDFDDEEISRKHTLSSSLAYAEWQKAKINLIDTPGFANFMADARAALRVVEAAVVVVDGVAGVEVQTEKLWGEAAALGLPRIVVVNRIDRERASLDRTLESLHRDCAREIVPVQIPLAEERAFNGVVDLVRMKALTFAGDESGKMQEGDVPDAVLAAAQAARERLIEMVAEADEQLMEQFFAEGTLTQEQLVAGLKSRHVGREALPSALHVRRPGHRLPAAARRPAELRPVTSGPRLPDPERRTGRARPRPPIADPPPRSCGRRLRTRSRAASRCCASSPAGSNPT